MKIISERISVGWDGSLQGERHYLQLFVEIDFGDKDIFYVKARQTFTLKATETEEEITPSEEQLTVLKGIVSSQTLKYVKQKLFEGVE